MKKQAVLVLVFANLLIACSSKNSTQNESEQQTDTTTQHVEPTDDLVRSSITNTEGETMDLAFDNVKGTLTVHLNGETIEMNRDKTGSGVAASNEHYKYNEWHGEISLEKDGKKIFEAKRKE